jgi:hypothetical protein
LSQSHQSSSFTDCTAAEFSTIGNWSRQELISWWLLLKLKSCRNDWSIVLCSPCYSREWFAANWEKKKMLVVLSKINAAEVIQYEVVTCTVLPGMIHRTSLVGFHLSVSASSEGNLLEYFK